MDFSAYELDPRFYDEMFQNDGKPRSHYRALHRALQQLSATEITDMQVRVARSFNSEGITFTVYGEANERIIPIDCLPRLLAATEWQELRSRTHTTSASVESFSARHLPRSTYRY